jgi:hypothetical protein
MGPTPNKGELEYNDGGMELYDYNPQYKKLYDEYSKLKNKELKDSIFLDNLQKEHERELCLYRNILIKHDLLKEIEETKAKQIYNEQLEHRLEDKKRQLNVLNDRLFSCKIKIENSIEIELNKKLIEKYTKEIQEIEKMALNDLFSFKLF